jgi:hypothetical protein
MKTTKSINIKNAITFTVTAERDYKEITVNNYMDGHNIETSEKKVVNETEIKLEVIGKWESKGRLTTKKEETNSPNTPDAYGYFIGEKNVQPLSEETYKKLEALIVEVTTEVEKDSNYQEYLETEKNNNEEAADYENHVQAVNDMMDSDGEGF